jgi:multiple antibiotic resistance protein
MENSMIAEVTLTGFFLKCFALFFGLFNPLSLMPVFMTFTAGMSKSEVYSSALRVISTGLIAAILFAFLGKEIFNALGITVDCLRIAGGILIFMIGYSMLFGSSLSGRQENIETEIKPRDSSFCITPLGIPLLCGPAALTAVMIKMETVRQQSEYFSFMTALILSIVAVMAVTFLILVSSRLIHRVLGDGGMKVVTKVIGLMLAVMAVGIFIKGATEIVHDTFGIPFASEVAVLDAADSEI